MSKLLSILLLSCSITLVSCQSSKLKSQSGSEVFDSSNQDYIIKGKYTQLKVDKLGHIYLLNSKNEILKYDQDYNLLFKNSYNILGEISHIDVSNPQKILVYFSDFQNILFLDNTLSDIKSLSLEQLSYWNIQAVGQSVDNFIWIYDPVNHKLIKINDLGTVQLSSNELFSDVIQGDNAPSIFARGDRVYLYTDKEVMTFNIFGQLLKTTMIKNSGIQFLDSHFLYNNGHQLQLSNTKIVTMEDSDQELLNSKEIIIDFFLDKNFQLFTLDKQGLLVKSLNENFK